MHNSKVKLHFVEQEQSRNPLRKEEALDTLGDWMWQTPERTGTLNRKEGTDKGDWLMQYCVLQANMLFFFQDAAHCSVRLFSQFVCLFLFLHLTIRCRSDLGI